VQSVTDTDVDVLAFMALTLVPEGGLGAQPALESEQINAMWYQVVAYRSVLGNGPPSVQRTIMTKAMRKITEIGQELQFQCDEIAAESNIIVQAGGHIFLKLP